MIQYQLPHILKHMQEIAFEPLLIEDIAKCFGYSACYFSRKFKQLTGFSAKEYLASLKIEHSIVLSQKAGRQF